MRGHIDESLLVRLQATSHALPVLDSLREVADDVSSWDAEGIPTREIEDRIRVWMDENDMGFEAWEKELAGLEEAVPIDLKKLWDVYGFEHWLIECVWSIADTDKPIPFFPYSAGMWIEHPEGDPPMLLAVITPLSDPHLAARQLVKKHRELFGSKAGKPLRADDVDVARMIEMHRAGMSYREIAIQNLRLKHPEILGNVGRYKTHIAREKDRVAKRIKAAQEAWNERLPESSTSE